MKKLLFIVLILVFAFTSTLVFADYNKEEVMSEGKSYNAVFLNWFEKTGDVNSMIRLCWAIGINRGISLMEIDDFIEWMMNEKPWK